MRSPTTNRHWREFSSTQALLVASGRRDPTVLAVLTTESFFRRRLERMLEYISWFILDCFNCSRADTISVGISQVQVRHWRKAKIVGDATSRFAMISKFCNPLMCYDACRAALGEELIESRNEKAIALEYTGHTTSYHISVLGEFLRLSLANVEKEG